MSAKRSVSALALAGFACTAGSAHAAGPDPPKELFGGYSSLRLDGENLAGGGLAFSWPLAGAVRLRGDATAQLGAVAGEDVQELAFLLGPAVALGGDRRLAPFAHAGVGLVRSRRQIEVFGVAIGPDGVCSGGCPWRTGLAAEAGGGLDLRVTRRLALRLPQLDYRLVRIAGASEGRLRAAAGLVWRWGR